jgi:hypothetical protein
MRNAATPAEVAGRIDRALVYYRRNAATLDWTRRGLADWIAGYSVRELREYAANPDVGLNVNLPSSYKRAEVVAYVVNAFAPVDGSVR